MLATRLQFGLVVRGRKKKGRVAEPPPSMIDQAVRSRGIEDVGQCSGYCRVKTSNTNRWFAAIQIVSQMLGLVFVGVEAVGADFARIWRTLCQLRQTQEPINGTMVR